MAFTKYSNVVLEVAKEGEKPEWLKLTNNTKEIDETEAALKLADREKTLVKTNKGE